MNAKPFVEVAVLFPIRKTFTYSVPEEMSLCAQRGKGVLVPFGRRVIPAYILVRKGDCPLGMEIMPLRKVLGDEFALSEKFLDFLLWCARYYLQPIGEIIKTALPASAHLRSRENYSLTAQGLEALDALPKESLERKLLLSLKRAGGEGPFPVSRSPQSAAAINSSVGKMVSSGWIAGQESSWEERTRAKEEKFICFLNSPHETRLTLRQKEVLDFIREAGEISQSEFNVKYKNKSSIILKLKEKQCIDIVCRQVNRLPPMEGLEEWTDGPPHVLNEDQRRVVEEINQATLAKKFHPFLLHGVTGSGKTEVYLQTISQAIALGRKALLLVPEIALTAQLVAYFRSRIETPTAILHSGLSAGERADEWRRIKRGEVKLVIGARSAVFAPLEELGIIIVDEEHDPSYKQEDKVRYHGRDLALVRGKMEHAVVVLGSATPSMESYQNCLRKKFRLLSLPGRIDQRPLPEIRIVDMRQEEGRGREPLLFSRTLIEGLEENTARHQQALLFLNRRGFSTFALCRDCGFVHRCPNCSVSLTYHLHDRSFRCHYCDYSLAGSSSCPQCASIHLQLFGIGTQRLEEEIKKRWPAIKAGRMDRDTTTRKSSHQKILNQVRRGEINLLIGTQMITKGHDLPRVTLVGVLAADLSLNVPDFRAAERTFQLLTQVAGRAGRGSLPGKVVIQTYNPEHYSILLAQSHDYAAFFEKEAGFRREVSYPPFSRLINLRMEGNSEEKIAEYAASLLRLAQALLREEKRFAENVEILGPAQAPLSRLKGKNRWQMLLKGKSWSPLHDYAEALFHRADGRIALPGIKLIVDVDPVNML